MRGAYAIFRRELASLLLTPLGWVLFSLAVGLNGVFACLFLRAGGGAVSDTLQASLGGSFHYWALMALLPPLLTMRMLSEESRSGLLEFLLTAPVSDAAVIAGKAAAATTFMALLWGTNLVYALAFQLLGAPPDWGQLAAGLLGSLLVSAMFCSAGLVCSALTSLPILAAFLAFLVNLGLLLISFVLPQLSWRYQSELSELTAYVDVFANLQRSFLVGAFDTAPLVFFLAWTGLFLALATRLLEARRWW